MKKLCLVAGLLLALTSAFAPTASAGGGMSPPDHTIDCSEDSDPSRENYEDAWVEFSGEYLVVLTENCAYTCALGNVDPNTSCTSAFFDSGVPRLFSVQGHGIVHGYSPGSYGLELIFGTSAEELGLSADQGDGYLLFEWNQIPSAVEYRISAVQDPDVGCIAPASEWSCAIGSAPLGETYSYVMSVVFDFDGITKTQSMVTTVDATLEPEPDTTLTTGVAETEVRTDSTLADTGSNQNSHGLAAIVLGVFGLLLLQVVRHRRAI